MPGLPGRVHTYSVIIDRRDPSDEHIAWYLDGQPFFSVSEPQVGAQVWADAVDHGFSVIFDLAMGGSTRTTGARAPRPPPRPRPGAR